tara:strand:+ start:693 stop:950 length:258 start_codon:yes stop_codon:yes gene_type:complete
MKTSHSVMLCFALWVGGTSLLINEYIHVGKEKDEALQILENEVLRLKNINIVYDSIMQEFVWRCGNKEEIRISGLSFMCYKIDKV